ncbi:lipopolysaccharide transport periplasmic protein LptA [Beggiatoa leptomitoformis]|uniref:Lipopolysaccharide export system protein LptA n=1 Tax=Beggiatoa leptomitoformis TaxID=288004 RepID=A0A2N9YHX8_9GAMM|nr:lipopolysaccharide transport periplasmic protein LptA [Beggiatoa leptomitoformis]ALG67617.1 lipopolysaccharide transport periplasmic protein LptA [Beggiatoa leptomitoformis]AUI70151.1 lipopolysaccharide transport periplasmic protein LptA [Beggiatoa leptomitoformis]
MSINKWLLGISMTMISHSVFALATDKDQPINITAEQATIDDLKGVAIYEGNVIVTQGTIRIEADKVTLTYTQKQTLDKVILDGNPARFKQRPDNSKEDLNAKASKMEYFATENRLQLTQNAEVWQGKDTFTGQRITYDTERGIIKANQKVQVTIQPRQQSSSSTPAN